MIIEDEIIGSHTDDHELQDSDNLDEVFEQFGIENEKKDEPPATEEVKEPNQEPKTLKVPVKINKEQKEVEIREDELPELYEKSFALDKERERKSEYEKSLDRVAKLQGFKDHADLLANLDRLEQEAKQKEENHFNELRQQLREEAEDAGLDPEKLEAYLDNHPVMKQAQQALRERQEAEEIQKQTKLAQEWSNKWSVLYDTYPELREEADRLASEGKTNWLNEGEDAPSWMTAEMRSRINRGYDPIDAYELAHKGTIQAATRKKTEQQIIKEQQLGMRSKVETNASSDKEPAVPAELASAFAAFGLPVDAAKKYVK